MTATMMTTTMPRWRRRSFEKFSNFSLCRRDRFGPKIIKIWAILAIFRPFQVFRVNFFRNFERPFTPRGWLRSARNFGKTRFRRFPTFDFSTPKQIFQMLFFTKKLFVFFCFCKFPFWRSSDFLSVTGRFLVFSKCLTYVYFLVTTLGGGVNESKRFFLVHLETKMTKKTLTSRRGPPTYIELNT